MIKEGVRLRCEFCDSSFVYVRIKTNELICRSCGHISKLKEKE
jgi:primosomal protein N'